MKKYIFLLGFIFCCDYCSDSASDMHIFKLLSVDFDVSLGKNDSDYEINYEKKCRKEETYRNRLDLLRDLYKKNSFSQIQLKELKIPKIIHQIWLGSSFPEKYKKWQHSWIALHPDWEYKLWTDEDIDKLVMLNKDLYEKSSNYGERSDIARMEILYQFGGVYVDTDFECIKPFDIFHFGYSFYASMVALENLAIIANGIIGAAPGHPILEFYIKKLKDRWDEKNYQNNLLKRSGPHAFEDAFFANLSQSGQNVIAFPPSYFFPIKKNQVYGKEELSDDFVKSSLKPETFAIHHWEGSWAKPIAHVNKN